MTAMKRCENHKCNTLFFNQNYIACPSCNTQKTMIVSSETNIQKLDQIPIDEIIEYVIENYFDQVAEAVQEAKVY